MSRESVSTTLLDEFKEGMTDPYPEVRLAWIKLATTQMKDSECFSSMRCFVS